MSIVKIQRMLEAAFAALPECSTVFLFGSAARTRKYRGIDLLILYDPAACVPKSAHREHAAFVDKATKLLGAPIHLSLLTYDEEKSVGFIARVSAVPITRH